MKHCDNCGQYKVQPRFAGFMAYGILIACSGWIMSIVQSPVAHPMEWIGWTLIIASIFIQGTVCTNCGKKTA